MKFTESRKNAVFLLIGIIFIIVLIHYILVPSYFSVAVACFASGEEYLEEQGMVVVGQVISGSDLETGERKEPEIKIAEFIDVDSDLYNKIWKHENCHVNQIKRGYPSLSCGNLVQKYLSEVECYTAEHLPDRIYYMFYEKY